MYFILWVATAVSGALMAKTIHQSYKKYQKYTKKKYEKNEARN